MFRSMWQIQKGILDEKWASIIPRGISCISSWAKALQCLSQKGHNHMTKDHQASKALEFWLGWNFYLRYNVTWDLRFRIFIGLHHSDKHDCKIYRVLSVASARYLCCVYAKLQNVGYFHRLKYIMTPAFSPAIDLTISTPGLWEVCGRSYRYPWQWPLSHTDFVPTISGRDETKLWSFPLRFF